MAARIMYRYPSLGDICAGAAFIAVWVDMAQIEFVGNKILFYTTKIDI
jgi:hypothetical protein